MNATFVSDNTSPPDPNGLAFGMLQQAEGLGGELLLEDNKTTKKCSKCGENKPFEDFGKSQYWCKNCNATCIKQRRQKNKEEIKFYAKQWYQDHKGEVKDRSHQWYLSHKEESKAYSKQRYLSHREEERIRLRKRYVSEKEERKNQDKQYRLEHKTERRIINNIRRTRKAKNGGSFTLKEWSLLCHYYAPENKCLCCDEIKLLTVDHVIPIKLGGTSNISNLQPICHSCNSSKHTKDIDYRPDAGSYAIELLIAREEE
jgi:5-methylcytosine-specific restriction endonuclease McrA